ncbi:MAG TPA: isoprenylcysteine carboxylmethyltransferase family protein [Alphaproteobacteria bacterium]|nr:isoprenylcysteine carboxylmethyltransferase family protein [Alphaproteobacteria bacterium]
MPLNPSLLIIIPIVALLRLGEVALGEVNARNMLREGGKEFSSWQRVPIFALYAVWLAALAFFTTPATQPQGFALGLFAALQLLRWWSIAHLGKFWTTRIVIVPLGYKITTGPYRFLHHPIYAVLMGEVMALSLAFDQPAIGCFFTGLTAWWVLIRMRAESRALQMML